MWIAEIWRYPVKSMGGERLQETFLRFDGVEGDRIAQVHTVDGRIIDARAHPRMLSHRATLGAGGELLVDGRPWDSPEVAREVEHAAGAGAHLVRDAGFQRFDVLPLLVATDGAIAALGHDGRRLRPNIIIGSVEGLAERGWEGFALAAGDALIGVHSLRSRCVMTTYDPDTQSQNPEVLKRIVRQFDGRIALDCYVIRQGAVRAGDHVELIEQHHHAPIAAHFGRYA